MARQATRLWAQCPPPGVLISLAGAVGAAAAVTPDLSADSRGRSFEALCDPPYRPTGGNAARNLFALLKPQRYQSPPAWRWSNPSIASQDPIDAALVPSLKRSRDVRHTLTALPALPQLSLLFRREPCPCMPLHSHTSSSAKIRRCCVDSLNSPRKQRRMGSRPGHRWRESGPGPDRCQAMGGARALKSVACDAVRSNSAAASSRNRPKTGGSGNDGTSAGTNAPARWISVQIGQWSSAGCSRPAGLEGAVTSSADGCAPAGALAPAETGAMRSRCTCPNETASWNASANSARYAPNLERDRNQLMVVSFARV